MPGQDDGGPHTPRRGCVPGGRWERLCSLCPAPLPARRCHRSRRPRASALGKCPPTVTRTAGSSAGGDGAGIARPEVGSAGRRSALPAALPSPRSHRRVSSVHAFPTAGFEGCPRCSAWLRVGKDGGGGWRSRGAAPLRSRSAAREGPPGAAGRAFHAPSLRRRVTVSLWRGVLLRVPRVWQVLRKQHGVRAGSTCPHPAARPIRQCPFSGAAFPIPWCTADAACRGPCLDARWLCVVVPISLVWLLSATSCSYEG